MFFVIWSVIISLNSSSLVQHIYLLPCNCPEIISDVITLLPEQCGFPTDHYIMEFAVVLKFKRADVGSPTFVWLQKGNFKDLCSLLSHVAFDMFVIALSGNIDECWVQLKGFFCQLLTNIYQLRLLSIRTCLLGLTTRFAIIFGKKHSSEDLSSEQAWPQQVKTAFPESTC